MKGNIYNGIVEIGVTTGININMLSLQMRWIDYPIQKKYIKAI